MGNIETTEMKLRSTPTGGVAGEHSPYYRRLLSAGYKGFLQGTIGGAGFYGIVGLAIGALVAVPTALALGPAAGPAAFLLIPAAGGVGVLKGASTFGNIGTVAAISAESADLAEQRRYLLDRYYELPDGPEGDKQAEIIKTELTRLQRTTGPHPLFHWKTVAVCAAIGVGLALAFSFPPLSEIVAHGIIGEILLPLHGLKLSVLTTAGLGAAVGGLMGAVVGIDRHYVRHWFDGTEKLLHDDAHTQQAVLERERQLQRLREAAKADGQTKLILERQRELGGNPIYRDAASTTLTEAPKQPVASLDTPETKVSSATLQHRLADIQQAMNTPSV